MKEITRSSRNEIKIGFISNFTGSYEEMVKMQYQGAELAVHEANKNGGILGKEIVLLARDDAQNAENAEKHARELTEIEQVDFMLGTIHSLTQMRINAVGKECGIPFISCSQSNVITTAQERAPFTFHEAITPYMNAQLVGKWGVEKLGKKWYHIGPDYPWGHEMYASYKSIVEKNGGLALGSSYVPLGAKEEDYEKVMSEVIATKPEVLVVTALGNDQVNFIRVANRHGIKREMTIVLSISDLNIIHALTLEELVGIYWGSNFYWGLEAHNQNAKKFVSAFRTLFPNEQPSAYAAYAYSAICELLEGAKATGSYPIDYKKMTAFMEGRNYAHYKEEQWWRPCDHQSFQDIYMMRFKDPTESTERYDIGEIIDRIRWDIDIERSCKDLGYNE